MLVNKHLLFQVVGAGVMTRIRRQVGDKLQVAVRIRWHVRAPEGANEKTGSENPFLKKMYVVERQNTTSSRRQWQKSGEAIISSIDGPLRGCPFGCPDPSGL